MLLACGGAGEAVAAPQDIVVVLDNSGSMRTNDPHGLARSAVERLIADTSADARLAIIIFDSESRMVVPLTRVDGEGRGTLRAALDGLTFRGPWTDIPGAVELAIYHLRQQGRPDVPHAVLFLTDGIVDTGSAEQDRIRETWLVDELLPLASQEGVRIFGIAFSEEADFRLIQTLAVRTNGDYARALAPEELAGAFSRLQEAMQRPIPVITQEPATPVAQPAPEPAPSVATTPEQPTEVVPVPAETGTQWAWLLLLLPVGAVVWWWMRGRGTRGAPGGSQELPSGAVLLDLGEVTGRKRIELNAPVTVIGRRPPPGPGMQNVVVIDQHTVSRHHATIRWHDGQYWIADHKSSNGTFVDGVQIEQETPIDDGARVRFDVFDFEFRVLQADATQMRGVPEEEVAGEHTIVRNVASSTTVFKPPVSGEPDVWSDIDDEVIDHVLEDFKHPDKDT